MATPRNTTMINTANPITVISSTDLIYIDQGGTTDAAISGANLISQINSLATTAAVGAQTATTTLVNAATTTNLAATYANGASGVGATLTVTATGTVTIDGQLVVLNGLYLFKNQTAALQNGVYLCTTAPAVGVNGVFTRSTSYNTVSQFNNISFIRAIAGTANLAATFCVSNIPIAAIGTTSIAYLTLGLISGGESTSLAVAGLVSTFIVPGNGGFSGNTNTPSNLTFTTPTLIGVSNGSAASSGVVGELLSQVIPSTSPVSLTSATPTNIATITLTPGDWDVYANFGSGSSLVISQIIAGISLVTATLPNPEFYTRILPASSTVCNAPVPSLPFNNITTNTQIWLVGYVQATGTVTGYGAIYARRRR